MAMNTASGGPAVIETGIDDEGNAKIEPRLIDASYQERDGKKYPAVIIKEYDISITLKRGDKESNQTRRVADIRVNYGKHAKKPDWRQVEGASEYKSLLNNHDKPFFTRVESKAEKK